MKPLLSFKESKALDEYVITTYGISSLELVESAGLSIFLAMRSALKELNDLSARILVIAGSGNNGADALTVAKYLLFYGYTNTSILLHESKNANIALKTNQLKAICNNLYTYNNPPPFDSSWDVIIDGFLGVGTTRPLLELPEHLASVLCNSKAPVVAIDVPSGIFELQTDTSSLPAQFTVISAQYTFMISPLKYTAFTPGFRKACGTIFEIGNVFPHTIPPALPFSSTQINKIDYSDIALFTSQISLFSHKYERGSILVYGGSTSYTGAPLLAAHAAEAAGAGLVTLRVPETIFELFAGQTSGIIIETDSSTQSRQIHACLCGPGWENNEKNRNTFITLYKQKVPLVIDATCLAFLDTQFLQYRNTENILICTPHVAEMARLVVALSMYDTYETALKEVLYNTKHVLCTASSLLHAVIVLKAATTWIASPDGTIFIYDGVNPSLAVGGSGDVLSGCIAAFLSRNPQNPIHAACSSVLLHGKSGELLAAQHGFFDAANLIDTIAQLSYKEIFHG